MARGLGIIQKLILELLADEPQGMYFSTIKKRIPIRNKGKNFKHSIKKALLGLDKRGLIERIPQERYGLLTKSYRYKLLKEPYSYDTTLSPGKTEIEHRFKVKVCMDCGAQFKVLEGTIGESFVICDDCTKAILKAKSY